MLKSVLSPTNRNRLCFVTPPPKICRVPAVGRISKRSLKIQLELEEARAETGVHSTWLLTPWGTVSLVAVEAASGST